MLAEYTALGIRFTNPELLNHASPALLLSHQELLKTICKLRGGDVDYVPLFVNFPDDVPDDDLYFAKRILGYLHRLALEPLVDTEELPSWLFELKDFGADPVSQFQTKSLWEKAKDRILNRKDDSHVEWIDMAFVEESQALDDLQNWMASLLSSKSSIKSDLHEDLMTCLLHFGTEELRFEDIPMKENQALVLKVFWQESRFDAVMGIRPTPTDLLRLFAALTDSDISLAQNIKFPKLSRSRRRCVLGCLENAASLREDLSRYRGLWLQIDRYLHSFEYRTKYPKTAEAFKNLRTGKVRTFNSETEQLIQGYDIDGLLEHLPRRPGVFGRKLHEVLRLFPDEVERTMEAFAAISLELTFKQLLVMWRYFATINDRDKRVIINKRGKVRVLKNNARGVLKADVVSKLDRFLYEQLKNRLRNRPSWLGKKVWIDPELSNFTVPLQERDASDGIISVGRGSRIALDRGKVFRFFVYWKQTSVRTDLDLSLIQFDKDFNYLDHVSYTRLRSGGIVHSGDLQSAPYGAAEFIDVTLSSLHKSVAFLAIQVYRYDGEAFADLLCHTGLMVREKADSQYQSFDIKTVKQKFDLKGRASYCVPLFLDIKASEMVITDLYMGTQTIFNNVEGSYGEVALACREVYDFLQIRPTLVQLANLHLVSRGAVESSREHADITFGFEGTTYNAFESEKILAELL
jgi:stress response protein SCP2